MRVALYSRPFLPALGGMERFTDVLAGWLTERGHDVTVVTRTPDAGGSDLRRPYRVVRAPGLRDVMAPLRAADVVHVNGLSLRGTAASLSAGRRPIVTQVSHLSICPTSYGWSPTGVCDAGNGRLGPCASCPMRGPKGVVKVRLFRGGASAAARNVSVSDYLLRRLALPRSTRIYNPVAGQAFRLAAPGAGEDGRIAFAGRLDRAKGVRGLIEAAALVAGARLDIAGDGPDRAVLEARVRELEVEERVRFLGPLDLEGVAGVYARAAVVCVPGEWGEPFGYAAAEAMAMERCIVVSPTGALPELAGSERGYVTASPSAADLAATLERALSDDEARLARAREAASFAATQFSEEAVGPMYESLYEEVAHSG